MIWSFTGIAGIIVGVIVGALITKKKEQQRLEEEIRRQSEAIEKQKEEIRRTAEKAARERYEEGLRCERERAKEELEKRLREAERESSRIRAQAQKQKERERRLEDKERHLWQQEKSLRQEKERLQKESERISALVAEQEKKLAEVSGMTREQAREMLLRQVERDLDQEVANLIRIKEEYYKENQKRIIQGLIVQSIQQLELPRVVEEHSVTVVTLPSDDMKGRIIGREGRNIRAFEMATGVDLVIDDTPETVTISSFDPVRREVAVTSLKRLIEDGRIHPVRIEQIVDEVKEEVERRIVEDGERAALEAGIKQLHPELVRTMGKMRFRLSYGQNMLWHSVEVAKLAARMAGEVGLDVEVCRRGGFLHDIGKAMENITESHAIAGAKFAEQCGENPKVVNAIASHHEEVPLEYPESAIVLLADAVSAVRPGARKESLEKYLERLEAIEAIAKSFEGVKEAYAVSAGRDLRVIVEPDLISDARLVELAREIVNKICLNVTFPGQIRVTVIRERRAVEVAR
ncbi:MAG: ribonuclease Y [bacterium JZ-2024 1]